MLKARKGKSDPERLKVQLQTIRAVEHARLRDHSRYLARQQHAVVAHSVQCVPAEEVRAEAQLAALGASNNGHDAAPLVQQQLGGGKPESPHDLDALLPEPAVGAAPA